MNVDRTLSERMRLGREAAPWVIEEVEKLENRLPAWIPVSTKRPIEGKVVVCKCLEDHVQTGFFIETVDWGDDEVSHTFKSVHDEFICVEAWFYLPE